MSIIEEIMKQKSLEDSSLNRPLIFEDNQNEPGRGLINDGEDKEIFDKEDNGIIDGNQEQDEDELINVNGGGNFKEIDLFKYNIKDKKQLKQAIKFFNRIFGLNLKELDKVDYEEMDPVGEFSNINVNIYDGKYGTIIKYQHNMTEMDFFKYIQSREKEILTFYTDVLQPLYGIKGKVKNIIPYNGLIVINKNVYPDINDTLKYCLYNYENDKITFGENIFDSKMRTYDIMQQIRMMHIFGLSGSGKTVLAIQLIVSGLLKKPGLINYYILEKQSDFDGLFKYRGIKYKNTVQKIGFDDIIALFLYFSLEQERRRKLFSSVGVSNAIEYNEIMEQQGTPEKKLNAIIMFIDEFKELRDSLARNSIGKINIEQLFLDNLASLVQVTRASYIFFWIATQLYGDAKGVPTKIRGNLSTEFIGGKVEGGTASSISGLTSSERAMLTSGKLYKGDFFLRMEGGDRMIVKTSFFSPELYKDGGELDKYIPLKEEYIKLKQEGKRINDDFIKENSLKNVIENVEKALGELGIEELEFNEKLESYGVRKEIVDKLPGINSKAFYFISNIFVDWLEKTVDMLENRTITPPKFDLQKEIQRMSGNEKYKVISMIFVLVGFFYGKFFEDYVESNFKIPSKIGVEDEEKKLEYIQQIKAFAIDMFSVIMSDLKETYNI